MKFWALLLILTAGFFRAAFAADYKPEFKMSVVVNEETKEARECQLAVGVSSRRLETVEFRTMRIR